MSREVDVHVPDIGDFDAVDVVEILVAPGDRVAVEDPLVSLESDKATMEVPSPVAGEVLSVKVSLGDAVSEGSLLVVVAASGEAPSPAPPRPEAPAPSPDPRPAQIPAEPAPLAQPALDTPPQLPFSGGRGVDRPVRAHAGPGIRREARELGVDLAQVEGSGRAGRVLGADLKSFVRETFERGGPGAMTSSAPDRVADVTDLETWRRRIPVSPGELQPSTLAVVLKAAVSALRAFPDLIGGAGGPIHVGVRSASIAAVASAGSAEGAEDRLVLVAHAETLGLRALVAALDAPGVVEGPEPILKLHHRLDEGDHSAQCPDPIRGARERLALAVGGLEVVPHWTGTADDALADEPGAHFEPRVVLRLAASVAPDLPPEIGASFLDLWAEILGAPARLLL